MVRTAWSVGALVVVVLAGGRALGPSSPARASTPTVPAATTTPRQRVDYLLYGDSLSSAAAPYLAASGTVGARYEPGTAPCDWLPTLNQDGATFEPREVLIQFVGNVRTPCTFDRNPPVAYRQDLRSLIQFWRARHVPVVMVLSPLAKTAAQYAWTTRAEVDVARRLGIPVRDAGRAVLNDGAFTFFLPCWSKSEPTCGAERKGMVRVRLAMDGLHFAINTVAYSAGAFRFGTAMADCWLGSTRGTSTVRLARSTWLACDPVPAGALELPAGGSGRAGR